LINRRKKAGAGDGHPTVGRFAQSIATSSVYAIVARDPEAADVRQSAFPLAFGRHSSALREPAASTVRQLQHANSEAASIPF